MERRVVFVTDHALFAGIPVLALSFVLAGCGARSALEQAENVEVEVTSSCAASCEEKHPDSLASLNKLKTGCACRTCNDACKQSVCFDMETPRSACLPCVQEGLSNQCSQHDGFFEGSCLGNKDCKDLVACITACPK